MQSLALQAQQALKRDPQAVIPIEATCFPACGLKPSCLISISHSGPGRLPR
jgi:hypothetical protein